MTVRTWMGMASLVVCIACGSRAASPTSASAAATGGTTAVTALSVTSAVAPAGGNLLAEHTCDGAGLSPPLAWSGAPAGTREFALLMSTLPGDGTTKWNWVLYNIPTTVTSLATGSASVGTFGVGSDGPATAYQPPCSQGPGLKLYTFTVYALSAAPTLTVPPRQVTGAILSAAIAPLTLAQGSITLGYTRPK